MSLILLAVLSLGLGTACSEKTTKQVGPTAPNTNTGGGTTGGGTGSQSPNDWSGETVDLIQSTSTHEATLDDLALYADFDTNWVKDLKINLDLTQRYNFGAGRWQFGGELRIGYTNTVAGKSKFYELVGETGSDDYSTEFNHWVTHNNEEYLKMFFETEIGAFLFVGKVDDDLGFMSGRLYFKRHLFENCSYSQTYPWSGCGSAPITQGAYPPKNCWRTTYYSSSFGYNVYDCRAYFDGRNGLPDMDSAIYPYNGRYKELGRFNNLNILDAGGRFQN